MVVRNVKILALRMEPLSLDVLIELMRCFPCLEKLYIQRWSTRENNLWRRKHRELIKCFDIRLKTIVISTYVGLWSEVNFATFFVLNAKLLELMVFEVNCTDEEFISKEQKKLQLDNRASRGAQFQFTTDRCLRGRLDIDHVRDLDLADPVIRRC
nr:uncharacterized protein LOC127299137 [Lolium perenne]